MNNRGKYNHVPNAFGSSFSLGDLPTHLPNTIPTKPVQQHVVSAPGSDDHASSTVGNIGDATVNEPVTVSSALETQIQPTKSGRLPPPSSFASIVSQETQPSVEQIGAGDETSTSTAPLPTSSILSPPHLSNTVPPTESKATPADAKETEKVFIPGTTITLETEEDIQRWIAERKKRWPTRKNIEEKEKAQAASRVNQADSSASRKRNHPEVNDDSNDNRNNNKKPRRICHFYQQNRKCRFGARCKNSHELAEGTNTAGTSSSTTASHSATRTGGSSSITIAPSSASVVKMINNVPVNIPQRFKTEFYSNPNIPNRNPHSNSATLFKMLVQKDHYENDNEKIIKFIEYLEKKRLIDHNVSFS